MDEPRSRRGQLAALCVGVFLLSLAVRLVNHQRATPFEPRPGASAEASGWFSADPDSLYHMRRVLRSLDGGLPVAPFDPFLAYPAERAAGAAIPWPPYYTLLLYGLIAPWAPDVEAGASAASDARRSFVERAVATWPAVFAALASAVLAWGGFRLAGGTARAEVVAALAAGATHALAFGSLRYSMVGNGDHHAFVSLCFSLLLVLGSLSLSPRALGDGPRCVFTGTVCGLLAGLTLGAWVAALELLALFELALLGLAVSVPAARWPGLRAFAVAYHGAALLALLPATVGSPWAILQPTSVVHLTWVQPGLAFSGFLFFASRSTSALLRAGGRVRLLWLGGAVVLATLAAQRLLGASVAEAFEWARGAGPFMGSTNESRPLVDAGAGLAPLFKFLGFGLPVASLGWVLAVRALAAGESAWAPCVVAFPVLLFQAAWNRRFAELALPCEALLFAPVALWACARTGAVRSLAFAALGAFGLAHPATLSASYQRVVAGERPETPILARARAERAAMEWLRRETPPVEVGQGGQAGTEREGAPALPAYGVLAQWDLGHSIVWAGDRPSVATNFGSYVGLESYLDPWRFFLATDEAAAEELLADRRVRYVVLTSRFRRNLDTMVRLLHPDEWDAWVVGEAGRAPRWLGGMGARLAHQMGGPLPGTVVREEGLAGLRLVYLSPDELRDEERSGAFGPAPLCAIFERVEGARVRATGAPGEVLRVSLRLRFPGVASERSWRGSARVGPDGVAELRVPYSATLSWSLGARRGELDVPETAVVDGQIVKLP